MAKKNVKGSFADELRKSAYIWVGNTNIENTQILLINFNNTTHWVVVENNEDNITLRAPKETTALSQEIFTALYEVNPSWENKGKGSVETKTLPAGLSIVSDCNNIFYDKGIKALKETTVVPYLYNLGIDITSYEYTTLSVDNSHSLVLTPIPEGYSNYNQELLDIMEDVSEYKSWTLTKEGSMRRFFRSATRKGMILEGPAGTGKSTDPLIYCAQHEIPVVVEQCTRNTDDDDVLSSFVPNTTGAGFRLRRGKLTIAAEHGGVCVLNEGNYTDQLDCVNSILDKNAQLILDDGTVIKVHPNFRLIITVNPNYRGTYKLNEALVNRCKVVDYEPTPESLMIKRLKTTTGYNNTKVIETIVRETSKIREIYQTRNYECVISQRNIEAFLSNVLLFPKDNIEEMFDEEFINLTALSDLNDIQIELDDLKAIRKVMLKEIKEAIAESNKEVTEASWTCSPQPDLDALTSNVNDDGSFFDIEEEEV